MGRRGNRPRVTRVPEHREDLGPAQERSGVYLVLSKCDYMGCYVRFGTAASPNGPAGDERASKRGRRQWCDNKSGWL